MNNQVNAFKNSFPQIDQNAIQQEINRRMQNLVPNQFMQNGQFAQQGQVIQQRDYRMMKPVYAMQEKVEKALSGIAGVSVSEVQNGNGYDVIVRIPVPIAQEQLNVENELLTYKQNMIQQIESITPEQFEQLKIQQQKLITQQKESDGTQAVPKSKPVKSEAPKTVKNQVETSEIKE